MKKDKLKKYNLKVLNDRVLIKPDEAEYQGASKEVGQALESGKLVLPEAYEAFYKNLPDKGIIVGIGDKCKYMWILGQHVGFAKMAASKIKENGEVLLKIREHDVDYVIED